MNFNEVVLDLMKRTKKGIAMFYVGTVYWLLLGLLSFAGLDIKLMGLIYFIGAGMLFPLGILVSKVLKIDFIAGDNPLTKIAGVLGGMQILFAPVLIFVYMENPGWIPFFVAILTGAHFLPFAVLYKSKAYFFQSFGVVGFTSLVGLFVMDGIFSVLSFGLSAIYFITSLLLTLENKQLSGGKTSMDTFKDGVFSDAKA